MNGRMVVVISDNVYNLIRVNGEVCIIIKDAQQVLPSIEWIVDKEADKFKKENPGDKILTEINRKDKTANIYIQKVGYVYNGTPARLLKIDVVQVPMATLN